MNMLCLRGKIEKRAGVFAEKIVEIFIVVNIQKMPIIQSRAFHLFVIQLETERLHHVQSRAGRGAGAADVAGVLRDFRLYQNNVENCHSIFLSLFETV